MHIAAFQFDDLLVRLARMLTGAPTIEPRGLLTKELLNVNMELRCPCRCILTNPVRKQKQEYLKQELEWYLSGTKQVQPIAKYASTWSDVADDDGTVNSAYGWQVFSQETPLGNSQFDYVVDELVADPSSRRAIININQVIHKYETKDHPCTVSNQFLIRDGLLHQIASMRSTDLVWGLCNDVPWFTMLQLKLLERINETVPEVKLGYLYLNSASLHVYERHFALIERLSKADRSVRHVSGCLADWSRAHLKGSCATEISDCCEGFGYAESSALNAEPAIEDGQMSPCYLYPLI